MAAAVLGAWPDAAVCASVEVYLSFDQPPADSVLAEMRKETETLFRPATWVVRWDRRQPPVAGEYTRDVALRMSGECRANSRLEMSSGLRPLGESVLRQGRVAPVGEVSCDEVRRFVSSRIHRLGKARGERLLGRALGRVLAHELWHMLAHTTDHAAAGIAKPHYLAHELIQREYSFQKREIGILRAAVPLETAMKAGATTRNYISSKIDIEKDSFYRNSYCAKIYKAGSIWILFHPGRGDTILRGDPGPGPLQILANSSSGS